MHKLAVKMISVAVSLAAVSPTVSANDWPNWGGPSGNGVLSGQDWKTELPEAPTWKTNVGLGYSSVAVVDGKLFTMGHDGRKKNGSETVYCLDAKTGKEIWKDSYPAKLVSYLHKGGPGATPAISGGKVYCLSRDGRFSCYDSSVGKLLWRHDLYKLAGWTKMVDWGFTGSPYVLDDTVYVEAGPTFAFDKSTGELKWKSKEYTPAYGSVTSFMIGERRYLTVLKQEGLVILEPQTGKEVAFTKWETRFKTNGTTPIIQGNRIFLSTGYKRGCGLFEFDPKKHSLARVYENDEMSNQMANSVLLKGFLYGIHGNDSDGTKQELVCMDFKTGKVRWRHRGLGCGSLIAVGDHLIVQGERGELVVAKASPESFEMVSSSQVFGSRSWTSPAMANGMIYCRNDVGDLVSLNVAKN